MALIEIDAAALATDEQQLRSQIEQLASLNSRLETLISRIDSTWEGRASEAYIAMMRSRYQKSVEMESVLREFLSYIQNAKTRFSSKDASNASKLRCF